MGGFARSRHNDRPLAVSSGIESLRREIRAWKGESETHGKGEGLVDCSGAGAAVGVSEGEPLREPIEWKLFVANTYREAT
jgi:hypothetical protein